MSQISINLGGIVRNLPDNSVPDGSMQELINLRPRDGALRPVGPKASAASTATDVRYIHRINDELYVIMGTDGSYLKYWVYSAGYLVNTTITTFPKSEDMRFAGMKNTLVVSNNTTEQTVVLLFDSSTYTYTVFDEFPDLLYNITRTAGSPASDNGTDSTSLEGDWQAALSSTYVKIQKEKADEGFITGKILVRCVWELFDGTLIKPTIPKQLSTSELIVTGVPGVSTYDITWTYNYYNVTFSLSSVLDIAAIKSKYANIIQSVKIFITLPKSPETEIGERVTKTTTERVGWFIFKDKRTLTITYDVARLAEYIPDPMINEYFLLKEYKLSDLSTTPAVVDVDSLVDLAMRQQLSSDNYTYHRLFAKSLFGYNERVFLGNIKNTLYSGTIGIEITDPGSHQHMSEYEVAIEYEILTGEKETLTVLTPWVLRDTHTGTAGNPIYFVLGTANSYWGYPDARAKRARILIRQGGVIRHMDSIIGITGGFIELSSNYILNFAYYKSIEVSQHFASMPVYTPVTGRTTYWDYNRIQATEINNPFYFPAINSYRIGNSEILGMSSNARALSQGQFGQFPVICFTSEGIWTMNIGTGETLINTITPISREVCNNPESITPIDGAVVFTTAKGLFIISGTSVTELSEAAEGDYQGKLSGNLNYEAVINNPILYQIKPYICVASMVTYISGAKIAWDQSMKEIIVSNTVYPYSWIFSVTYKSWFKISQSWSQFVPDYPNTYGYNFPAGIYTRSDMGNESAAGYPTVHFQTRPLKLAKSAFKKLHRLLIQGYVNDASNFQFSIAVFGSPDLINWYLLNNYNTFSAKSRLLVGRSTFSCRHYILIIGGNIDLEAYFTGIDTDIEERFHNKLR